MSGASIASICRAAASHALERAVYDFESMEHLGEPTQTEEDYYYSQSIMNCLVTMEDFEFGLNDILDGMKGEDEDEKDGTSVQAEEEG